MAFPLAAPAGYLIERLNSTTHDRGEFSCGVEALDAFLRTQAAQDQDRNTSVCHVLLQVNTAQQLATRPVVGYVSLANAELPLNVAPDSVRKISKRPKLPALIVGRMAVDHRHQGRRLGEFLLKYALKCACDVAEVSGCFAVLVDAKDDHVKSFYVKYGFEPLLDQPLRLFISVATVQKALSKGAF